MAVSAAIIGLGPLAVYLALRLPPINQVDYADAWFYSAYAWVPRHHFSVFEWNYFSVRFPAILSIGLFERVFGVYGGYIVLRYLLAVGSGAAVYLAVRRFSTVSVAAGATALLYLNPFFSRMLLFWDYASFVVVSAGTAGLALWWWTDGRRLAWTLIPGGALATAVFANVIFATALLVLVAVEGAAALRRGTHAVLRLGLRLGVAGASAVLVFLAGFLGYEGFTSLTPDDLVRPTIDFLRSKNSALYQHPVGDWLGHELRIWAPVIVSVALIAALRGRLFGTDLRARVAQLCIGYTAFLWLYRFLVTSSVLETWWAYSVVVVVVAPALGVLIDEVSRTKVRASGPSWGCCALTALGIRTFDGSAVDLYGAISDRPRLVWTIVAAAVGGTLLLAARSRATRTAALVAVVVSSTAMSWAPSTFDGRGETGVLVSNGDLDWDAYGGAKQFVELVSDYDARGHRVYTWYPDTQEYKRGLDGAATARDDGPCTGVADASQQARTSREGPPAPAGCRLCCSRCPRVGTI